MVRRSPHPRLRETDSEQTNAAGGGERETVPK